MLREILETKADINFKCVLTSGFSSDDIIHC